MKKGRLLLLIGLVSLLFLGLAGCAFLEALFASIPDTPGTVTVTSNADGTMKITWSSVSDATSYQLLRDFTSDGEFADPAVYDDSSPSFTDTDVFAPFYYFYKVRATNSAGSSEFSDAVGGLTIGTYYWGSFGSDVLFATNDTAEYFTNELFTIDGINSNLTLESSLVASVSKAGGWYDGDIGIIFSFTDINNYWKFVIGPSGYYGIFRKSGGVWGTIVNYTVSADVITGYGATNELQVDYYSGAGVNIEFFINGVSKGVLPGTALDESAPTGFIAQIGDETAEIFPDEPVFNLYQQSLPVAFGGADAGAHARIIDKSGIAKHLVGQAQKPPQSGRPLK